MDVVGKIEVGAVRVMPNRRRQVGLIWPSRIVGS